MTKKRKPAKPRAKVLKFVPKPAPPLATVSLPPPKPRSWLAALWAWLIDKP